MTLFQKAAKSAGINIMGGFHQEPGIVSVGGNAQVAGQQAGAAFGYDSKKKKLFGSVNVNHKVIGQFGPQE